MDNIIPEELASLWRLLLNPASYKVIVLIILGVPLVILLSKALISLLKNHLSEQSAVILNKAIRYSGYFLLAMLIMHQLGYKMTTLLGAAGVFGVAIGFASQTSLSNIISGLFLLSEKPFAIGDLIEINGTKGMIVNIDLLAVKLRTFDNKMIRIPNENLLKNQVTNITRYPIRRMDINISVAYKENIEKVRNILRDIAIDHPLVLDEPEPLILFTDFGESGLQFLYGIWFSGSDLLMVKNEIMEEIKKRFDVNGIEIPFPHRTIYVGEATKPLPVKTV